MQVGCCCRCDNEHYLMSHVSPARMVPILERCQTAFSQGRGESSSGVPFVLAPC